MHTAHITGLDRDEEDGVLLIKARCDRCRTTVVHGAGHDLDNIQLGHRVAHCGCGDYALTDPNGIVPLRLRVLREQEPAFRARLQAAAHRRRVEEAEEKLPRVLAETGRHPLRRHLVKEAREALQAARVAVIDPA